MRNSDGIGGDSGDGGGSSSNGTADYLAASDMMEQVTFGNMGTVADTTIDYFWKMLEILSEWGE